MTRLFSDCGRVDAHVSDDVDLGECLTTLELCNFYFWVLILSDTKQVAVHIYFK
jgi:hypothetical protein